MPFIKPAIWNQYSIRRHPSWCVVQMRIKKKELGYDLLYLSFIGAFFPPNVPYHRAGCVCDPRRICEEEEKEEEEEKGVSSTKVSRPLDRKSTR